MANDKKFQLPQLSFAHKLLVGLIAVILVAVAFVGLTPHHTTPVSTAGAPFNAYFTFASNNALPSAFVTLYGVTQYRNFTSVENGTYSRAYNYSTSAAYLTTNPAMPDQGGAQASSYTAFNGYSNVNNYTMGAYNSSVKPILFESFDYCGDYNGTSSYPCNLGYASVNAVSVNLSLMVSDINATLTNGTVASDTTNATVTNTTKVPQDMLFTISVNWVNGSIGTCTSTFSPTSASLYGAQLLSGCNSGVNVSTIRSVVPNVTTPSADLNLSFKDANGTAVLLAYYYINTTATDNTSFYTWNYASSSWDSTTSSTLLQGNKYSKIIVPDVTKTSQYLSGGPLFIQVAPGKVNSSIKAGWGQAVWNVTESAGNRSLRAYKTSGSDQNISVTIFGYSPTGVLQKDSLYFANTTTSVSSVLGFGNISMIMFNASSSNLNGSIVVQGGDNNTAVASFSSSSTLYANESYVSSFVTSSATAKQTPPNGLFYSNALDSSSCDTTRSMYIQAIADANNNTNGIMSYQGTNVASPVETDWVNGANSFGNLNANTLTVYLNGSDSAFRYFRVRLSTASEDVPRSFNIKLSCTQPVG